METEKEKVILVKTLLPSLEKPLRYELFALLNTEYLSSIGKAEVDYTVFNDIRRSEQHYEKVRGFIPVKVPGIYLDENPFNTPEEEMIRINPVSCTVRKSELDKVERFFKENIVFGNKPGDFSNDLELFEIFSRDLNAKLKEGKKEEKIILREIYVNRRTPCAGSHFYKVLALINKNYLVSLGNSSIDCTNIPKLSKDLIPEDYIPINIPSTFYYTIEDNGAEYVSINEYSNRLKKEVLEEVMEYVNKNIILGERGKSKFLNYRVIPPHPEPDNKSLVDKVLCKIFNI